MLFHQLPTTEIFLHNITSQQNSRLLIDKLYKYAAKREHRKPKDGIFSHRRKASSGADWRRRSTPKVLVLSQWIWAAW